MSFFSHQTTTTQIDGENGVTLRKLTHGETNNLINQCMVQTFEMVGKEMVPRMELDALKYRDLCVFSAIVAWSGPGFEDRPVTFENFCALPSSIVEIISKAVDAFAALRPEEKKEFGELMNTQ